MLQNQVAQAQMTKDIAEKRAERAEQLLQNVQQEGGSRPGARLGQGGTASETPSPAGANGDFDITMQGCDNGGKERALPDSAGDAEVQGAQTSDDDDDEVWCQSPLHR
jgi:hypothetical protein